MARKRQKLRIGSCAGRHRSSRRRSFTHREFAIISTDRFDRTIGPLVASMVAGPLTALPILLRTVPSIYPNSDAMLVSVGFVLICSTPVGFVASLIPNIAGTWLMFAIGRRCAPIRYRFAWAGAGIVGGWLIGVMLIDDVLTAMDLWMGFVGAVCALICRAFVRWRD